MVFAGDFSDTTNSRSKVCRIFKSVTFTSVIVPVVLPPITILEVIGVAEAVSGMVLGTSVLAKV